MSAELTHTNTRTERRKRERTHLKREKEGGLNQRGGKGFVQHATPITQHSYHLQHPQQPLRSVVVSEEVVVSVQKDVHTLSHTHTPTYI